MTIDEIIAKYGAQLATVNPILFGEGLPTYYQGNGVLHPDYEWANTPRIIWRWWPPGLALDQLYLKHRPTEATINIHGIASGKPFVAG